MTKIWYCRNCGYEVTRRGRCHACREKFTPSDLPQLEAGPEDEEVGYDIEGWPEPERGRLIQRLNDLGVMHRFEDEELVVDASDEARVDDLVATLADTSVLLAGGGSDEPGGAARPGQPDGSGDPDLESVAGSGEAGDPGLDAAVRFLADAASRLRRDPTDMQADADVAEASAAVFIPESYGPLDEDTWTAVGRVTRRLLSMLGAEEALEDGIRAEAAVLEKLLEPVSGRLALGPEGTAALGGTAAPAGAASLAGPSPSGAAGLAGVEGEKTVYELPEWLPEQRAQLGVLLDDARIAYEWEGIELIVPADRETEVEDLFGRVAGVDADESEEDDEVRYQAVAELFAACSRLASEPSDQGRRDTVVEWIDRSAGPPLFGMDEVDWFRISSLARSLAGAIEAGDDPDLIGREAGALHDILRTVV